MDVLGVDKRRFSVENGVIVVENWGPELGARQSKSEEKVVGQERPNGLEPEPESASGESGKSLSLLGRQLPFESETNFYILANALDVVMTVVLLNTGGFRESNEIANQVLNMFGSRGLIFFKFAIVAFVCVLAQVIAVKQPQTARKLLIGGTVVVFGVVLYSGFLYLKYSGIMG